MLAAEFHYDRFYCDRYMDLDDFIAHINYHSKNPPAGAVLVSLVKAFVGGDEKTDNEEKVDPRTSVFTPEVKKKLETMGMDEKFKYLSTLPLTPEQITKGRSLDNFMDDFGAVGGQVK